MQFAVRIASILPRQPRWQADRVVERIWGAAAFTLVRAEARLRRRTLQPLAPR